MNRVVRHLAFVRSLPVRPVWRRSACGAGAVVAGVLVATQLGFAATPAESLQFGRVFAETGEPPVLHYRVTFASGGTSRQMEIWRDGDRRLRRRTDDAIDTFVVRQPGQPEFHMAVLDLKKKIVTEVDRSNLYRIGHFTDWYDLAHGIRFPKGSYVLNKASAPPQVPKPLDACFWYDLSQQQRTTHICWSTRNRLPLMMVNQDGEVLWQVTQIDRNAIPNKTFELHDEGYIHNNANDDIDRD